jgi:hypothetical protein
LKNELEIPPKPQSDFFCIFIVGDKVPSGILEDSFVFLEGRILIHVKEVIAGNSGIAESQPQLTIKLMLPKVQSIYGFQELFPVFFFKKEKIRVIPWATRSMDGHIRVAQIHGYLMLPRIVGSV